MTELLTNCPVCNGEDFHPFVAMKGGGDYHLCKCGAAFLNPRKSEDELRDYYVSGDYRRKTAENDPDNYLSRRQTVQRAEYIAEMVRLVPAKSHLDIGCYEGDLLGEVRKKHPKIKSVGVDPVKRENSYVKWEVFQSLDDVKGKFDIITVIQTLEHINDPVSFFKKVYKKLSKQGVLVVEVPNRRANLVAYIPPHHVICYDEDSIRLVMKDFKIDRLLYHGQPDKSPLDLNLMVLAHHKAEE